MYPQDRLLLELSRRHSLPPRLQWHAIVLCLSSVASVEWHRHAGWRTLITSLCFIVLCHSARFQTLKDIALEFHDAGVLVLLPLLQTRMSRLLSLHVA